MCGRIALFTPPIRLARFLDAALAAGIDPEGRPSWNVGPQQTLFALTVDGAGDRTLGRYRWGLLPSWAKDPTLANRLFNARAETVTEKPSFRSAFAKRPCVIPVDGFYEWDHREGRQRQPHYFTRRDGTPLLLAGLHETWIDRDDPDAPPRHTCTVITTTPNNDIDGIHDRMPVIVSTHSAATWLDTSEPDVVRHQLLAPAPNGTLEHWGVGSAVGNVRNNGPELIERNEPTTLF
jgi:putative SOS response-associated peptidase YedK